MPASRLISILLPTQRNDELLDRALDALRVQSFPRETFQALVLGPPVSEHRSLPLENAEYLALEKNYGTTGAINRGAAARPSKYLLMLNDDVELASQALERLFAAVEAAVPGIVFATCKLLNATEHSHLDGAGDALLMAGGAYRLGHQDVDSGQFDQRAQILAGCGAAWLVRRSAFGAVGGMDEKFFAY